MNRGWAARSRRGGPARSHAGDTTRRTRDSLLPSRKLPSIERRNSKRCDSMVEVVIRDRRVADRRTKLAISRPVGGRFESNDLGPRVRLRQREKALVRLDIRVLGRAAAGGYERQASRRYESNDEAIHGRGNDAGREEGRLRQRFAMTPEPRLRSDEGAGHG